MAVAPVTERYATVARTTVERMKFEARVVLAQSPVLYQVAVLDNWLQVGRRSHVVVHRGTELVIDGFQGSANSYSIAALRRAQDRHIEVAHHLHCPRQVIVAVRRRIPVLVLLREPRGAVLSLVSRWPHLSLRQGLRDYARYYRHVLTAAEGFVVGTFPQVTGDFGAVMTRVNQRYGTQLPVLVPGDDRGDDALYDAGAQDRRGRRAVVSARAAELTDPKLAVLLRRAEGAYQDMLALSETAATERRSAPPGAGSRRSGPSRGERRETTRGET